jgi:tRNA:m4X modification enzyme
MFFIARKQRFCAMERAGNGATHCGAHLHLAPGGSLVAGGAGAENRDQVTGGVHLVGKMARMACPVDPSHTIFVRNRAAHVKVCTRARQQATMEALPFFARGINGGINGGARTAAWASASSSSSSLSEVEVAAAAALPHYGKHRQEGAAGDGRGDGVDVDALIAKVRGLCARHAADFPPPYEEAGSAARAAAAMAVALEQAAALESTGVRHGNKRDKHAEQQAGIVAHMVRRGLLRPSGGPAATAAAAAAAAIGTAAASGSALAAPTSAPTPAPAPTTAIASASAIGAQQHDAFIEYGAGRGMLGLAIRRAQPTANMILVERMSTRGKADRVLREGGAGAGAGAGGAAAADAAAAAAVAGFFRAGVDIRDLDVSKLPFVEQGGRVVGVAKHLCGLATDLTLRSFLTTGTGAAGVRGAAIATCCHHRCSWADYVARGFFESRGFSQREFELLMHWTGWVSSFSAQERAKTKKPSQAAAAGGARGGGGAGEEVQCQHQPSTLQSQYLRTTADQAELGRQCKRLVDLGRMDFLRGLGFRAELVHYCPEDVSLENALIVTWRE